MPQQKPGRPGRGNGRTKKRRGSLHKSDGRDARPGNKGTDQFQQMDGAESTYFKKA